MLRMQNIRKYCIIIIKDFFTIVEAAGNIDRLGEQIYVL
jgi:hypothetical protein